MNIFEKAAIAKLRFDTNRGTIPTELLYDLPLTSQNGFDLDTLAIGINRQLKEVTEESFVQTSPNAAKAALELKLDILKHVIASKITERDRRKKLSERAAQREKLLDALAHKQEQELLGMSVDEIKKELAALDAEEV